MACKTIDNVHSTLLEKKLIDSKFNIIGNTQDVFPYINTINQYGKDKYGIKDDLISTKTIPARLGKPATVKVVYNQEVGQQIDSIKDNPKSQSSKYSSKEGFTPSTELEEKMYTFLKDLGFTVDVSENITRETGYYVSSATDLLYKNIVLIENPEEREKSLVKETAYVAVSMLGKKNKIRTDLIHSIDSLPNYPKLYSSYKSRSPNLNDYKIKELILIDIVADSIYNNYQTPKESYVYREADYWQIKANSSFEKKLKILMLRIRKILDELFNIKYSKINQVEYENLLDSLSNDVINNYNTKFNTKLKEDQQLVTFNETLEKNVHAKEIIEKFAELNIVLTGSLALRKEGTLYRSAEENLHDLDFTVTNSTAMEFITKQLENIEINYPPNFFSLSEQEQSIVEESLIRAARKEALNNLTKDIKESDFIKKIKEIYPTYKITNIFGGLRSTDISIIGNIQIGEESFDIDFFFVRDENYDLNEKNIQDWEKIFLAKLKMGRAKDMSDFANYQPYYPVPIDKKFKTTGFRHFNFKTIEPISKDMLEKISSPINTNMSNNNEEESADNIHNAEIINPDLIQFAFDPWDSEQLENEGYTYIGNLDIEDYGYSENGNYPAYYKFEENNISTFAEQVLKCE